MSPLDADLVLMNKTNLDSGTDGAGSGADPTATAGRIVNLQEEAPVAVYAYIVPSDTGGEPGDADTLSITVECAPDGTNFGQAFKFRSIVGTEAPDDTAAGDKSLRLAGFFRVPRSTQAGIRTVPTRLTTVASDTSNWGVYIGITDQQSVRSEYLANAIEA